MNAQQLLKRIKIIATWGLHLLWQCLAAAEEGCPVMKLGYSVGTIIILPYDSPWPSSLCLPGPCQSMSQSYSGYLRGQYPLISPWLISFTQRPACFFPLNFQYLLIQHHWVHSGAPLLMPRRLLQSLFHCKAKNQPLHQKHASENSSPVSTWTFRSSRPFVCSSNSTPTVKSTL